MGELNYILNWAQAHRDKAAQLVSDAQSLAVLNPLMAAGKIKQLALKAAELEHESAKLIHSLADALENVGAENESLAADLTLLRRQLGGLIKQ
ncbi:hypothetical protein ORI99_01780 [Alishewanella sp. SMS9]|uniref:hypothetical protein n=1 Tax=Burkholderia vietnamiensis TaxID=60552 RepID=UPI0027922982|nr:hypothetical protein [Alishewanella sp. SMS9]